MPRGSRRPGGRNSTASRQQAEGGAKHAAPVKDPRPSSWDAGCPDQQRVLNSKTEPPPPDEALSTHRARPLSALRRVWPPHTREPGRTARLAAAWQTGCTCLPPGGGVPPFLPKGLHREGSALLPGHAWGYVPGANLAQKSGVRYGACDSLTGFVTKKVPLTHETHQTKREVQSESPGQTEAPSHRPEHRRERAGTRGGRQRAQRVGRTCLRHNRAAAVRGREDLREPDGTDAVALATDAAAVQRRDRNPGTQAQGKVPLVLKKPGGGGGGRTAGGTGPAL